ncbi:MAG TPA: hypothetical protein VLA89_05600 [Gemmatimonadales bacterium]|nr:hypothetical protein [Gemmatimonadales bacterium]
MAMNEWRWGGDDPDLMQRDRAYQHAIFVPGHGWFGGFPPEIAKRIVDAVNAYTEREP